METKVPLPECDSVAVSLELVENQDAGMEMNNGHNVPSRLSGSFSHRLSNADSDDLANIPPRPYRSLSQVLALSYVSLMCCLCVGAYANTQALKAKSQEKKGQFVEAQRTATVAVRVAYVSIFLGIVIFSVLISLIAVNWPDEK